jgi:hypothetical protein
MAKVFGLHEIELPPGVEPEEYERFFAEETASMLELAGWKTRLLKGDRGARTGKYLVLFEIESQEARDRYFPRPGEASEEFTRFFEQRPEAAAALKKLQEYGLDSESDITTDYVIVAE